MKIDMNYKFKEIDGKTVIKEKIIDEHEDGNPKRDGQGFPLLKVGKPRTLRSICIRVLSNPPSIGIDKMTGREKEVKAEDNIKYAVFAERIYKSNSLIDLSAEEIVVLKDFINKTYNKSPLLVKQAYDILDPTTKN